MFGSKKRKAREEQWMRDHYDTLQQLERAVEQGHRDAIPERHVIGNIANLRKGRTELVERAERVSRVERTARERWTAFSKDKAR